MDTMQELFKIDFSYVLISVFVILLSIKAIVSIFEWFISFFYLTCLLKFFYKIAVKSSYRKL